MKCVDCGRVFLNFKKYIFHVTYLHNKNNYFLCPFPNCTRLYNKKSDFKKHVHTKHNSDKSNSEANNVLCDRDEKICSNVDDTISISLKLPTTLTDTCSDTSEDSSHNVPIACQIKQKLEDFKTVFNKSLPLLISKFYDNLNLTRSTIQKIIEDFNEFLSCGLVKIIKECIDIVCQDVIEDSVLKYVFTMLEIIEKPFTSLNSEFKRVQYFEQSQYFIKPVEHKIGVSQVPHKTNGQVVLELKNDFSYYIPMNKTLKSFLEVPLVYQTIIDYQNSLMDSYDYSGQEPMYNIVNGSIWRSESDTNKIILPIVLYFDDFETGNPLGSHAGCNKLGALYFTISTIPPSYCARLENIFLCYLFYSSSRAQRGNAILFDKIVEEIICLERDGIVINISAGQQKVYFKLACITGDNLGLHTIFGFNESFSSTYFCRFCITLKSNSTTQTQEDENLVRYKKDYDIHLNERVGLKETCVWHRLPNFHIYTNMVCDIMHDIYEGVLRYDMALIIQDLIGSHCFSLEHLNSRIKYCTYEKWERNVPPSLKKEHIANGCIILSAAEMLCLTRNFRFIIGDLVSAENRTWKFYIILLGIVDIVTSTIMSSSTLELLKSLISEHHELYIELFKRTLKPKHHFLVHYMRIMKIMGPVSHLSCMRFEAKHKEMKNIAYNVRNTKNVPYTLAFRAQLKHCYRFLAKRGFNNETNFSSPRKVKDEDLVVLERNGLNPQDYCCVTWYENNGIRYDLNSVLVTKDGAEGCCPQFAKISNIFVNLSNNLLVSFLGTLLDVVEYNNHYKAYKVKISDKNVTFVHLDTKHGDMPTIIHHIQNEFYVSSIM